ncbi:hypothetical protein BS47DRAFT_771243 [Hydnum rufescens UP504]|uniref:Uncharacterized protein n=1 Tax=Hydnum rufescens UP504 TaxID=1448309 RepID=A0A9P6B173_9AGAM|nr:hypothetical protein BS47DRAFT_771243 [Hydnum rufescens UP504]
MPLGAPSNFELTWCLTRKPEMEPTRFSLCVRDISLVARWVSKVNKRYDLLRNNCSILRTSISSLALFHYFQHEFDQISCSELVALRSAGPIRYMVSKFFSGPNRFLNWFQENKYYRQAKVKGEHESAQVRTEIPFLR